MNETQHNASLDLLLHYMKLFQWSFSTLLAFNDLDFCHLKKDCLVMISTDLWWLSRLYLSAQFGISFLIECKEFCVLMKHLNLNPA